jgi:hypothetical protein
MSTPLDRARARLAARTKRLAAALKRVAAAKAAVAQTTQTIKRLVAQSKAGPWMPGVAHDPVASIGASTVGAKGGVLHTTEGLDFAAMDRVLKSKNAYPLKSTVAFTDAAHVRRLSGQAWVDYTGWCGHQHVPEQPSGHWDPGAVDIGELLAMARRIT